MNKDIDRLVKRQIIMGTCIGFALACVIISFFVTILVIMRTP